MVIPFCIDVYLFLVVDLPVLVLEYYRSCLAFTLLEILLVSTLISISNI